MRYLKPFLFLTGLFITLESAAQSYGVLVDKVDSIKVNIQNHYEADGPPIDMKKLRGPILYILNGQELDISGFSTMGLQHKKIESVTVLQDPELLKEKYHSVVKVEIFEGINN